MAKLQSYHRLPRRTFLRAAGVTIAMPLLDAMFPIGLRAERETAAMSPKRMVLICRDLGFHAENFFPQKPGKDYEPSRYMKVLQEHRKDFTVFSGVSHRGYPASHGTYAAMLTGVAPIGFRDGNDVRNTISIDQEVASRIGNATRFPYLSVGGNILSFNRKGVGVPSEYRAPVVFKQLFITGTPAEVAREVTRINAGQSILDGVRDQAKSLSGGLGQPDRDRIDLLLTSVREAEQRLQQDQAWASKPKPKVEMTPFTLEYINDLLNREKQWFDLVQLALQTDSTRVIALAMGSHGPTSISGISLTHHDASHHGQDPEKLRQLGIIEESEVKLFGDFLGKLKGVAEGQKNLLDRTSIFYSTNLGNASAHTCDNLPTIIAGGGFKHAGHVAFDRKENAPLSNLFVRMLQNFDIEVDRFGSSTGVMSEV